MSTVDSKCDDCAGPAPLSGRFIEPKPLVDGKWLCDGCFGTAIRANTSKLRRQVAERQHVAREHNETVEMGPIGARAWALNPPRQPYPRCISCDREVASSHCTINGKPVCDACMKKGIEFNT